MWWWWNHPSCNIYILTYPCIHSHVRFPFSIFDAIFIILCIWIRHSIELHPCICIEWIICPKKQTKYSNFDIDQRTECNSMKRMYMFILSMQKSNKMLTFCSLKFIVYRIAIKRCLSAQYTMDNGYVTMGQ